MRRLVIVESPTKAATIRKYLGASFEVVATAGHFRDLPDDRLGVDLRSFDPEYLLTATKARYVSAIRKALQGAQEVFLATDADREGEAISWHLAQTFRLQGAKRMRFTAITPKALQDAVLAAGPLDQHLVDAQQARRVLDRLVGYQVSPLLRCYGPNHSAGRVQTATLHLVVQREIDRETFQAVPYWTVAALYGEGFSARYATQDGQGRWAEARLSSEAAADAVATQARNNPHRVVHVGVRPLERRPKAPFTTSTLQQAASAQLAMKPERTMAAAQALFEKGLISYHRTDSVALSEEALAMARAFIAKDYPAGLPSEPVRYRQKASAQGAHEAIHPTDVGHAFPPEVGGDELRLYDLIRRRFLGCQCRPARFEETEALIEAGTATFRTVGLVLKFAGHLHYLDQDEDSEAKNEEDPQELPLLEVGHRPLLEDLVVSALKTTPKPRFTRATLIKEMERLGIGRPATYVNAVGVLFQRDYLFEAGKQVGPTQRGRVIDQALGRAFPELGAATYTAAMEAQLDRVAEGRAPWKQLLATWHRPFAVQLERAGALFTADAARPQVRALLPEMPQVTEKACPLCSRPLHLRQGGKGAFLACSGYPSCTYSSDPSAQASTHRCPVCQGAMDEMDGKFGRYARCLVRTCAGRVDLAATGPEACPLCTGAMKDRGRFYSCAAYPACKGTRSKPGTSPEPTRICPACKSPLRQRKGPTGRAFWGCTAYPECRHTQVVTAERRRLRHSKAG